MILSAGELIAKHGNADLNRLVWCFIDEGFEFGRTFKDVRGELPNLDARQLKSIIGQLIAGMGVFTAIEPDEGRTVYVSTDMRSDCVAPIDNEANQRALRCNTAGMHYLVAYCQSGKDLVKVFGESRMALNDAHDFMATLPKKCEPCVVCDYYLPAYPVSEPNGPRNGWRVQWIMPDRQRFERDFGRGYYAEAARDFYYGLLPDIEREAAVSIDPSWATNRISGVPIVRRSKVLLKPYGYAAYVIPPRGNTF